MGRSRRIKAARARDAGRRAPRPAWRPIWTRAIAVAAFAIAWASLYWMMPLEDTALYGPIYRAMNVLMTRWFGMTGDWMVVGKAYLMVAAFIAIQRARG